MELLPFRYGCIKSIIAYFELSRGPEILQKILENSSNKEKAR
jgi:hypothetical protein